jgi:hypothetical protein
MIAGESTSWLLNTLRLYRKRPAMFLRDDRIESLASYLAGVFYGLELAGTTNTDEQRFLHAFGS